MSDVYETRAVLADAYQNRGPMLTHAVRLDADGNEVDALCGRVQVDSLADRFASDPHAPPTCPRCVKLRLAR